MGWAVPITTRDIEIAQEEILAKLGPDYENPAWPFAMIAMGVATLLQEGMQARAVLACIRRMMIGLNHAKLGLDERVSESLRKLEQEL